MAKIKSEDLLQSIRETAPSILARDVDKIDDVLESIGDAIKKLTTDYTFEHIQHDGVDKNGKKISVDELRIRVKMMICSKLFFSPLVFFSVFGSSSIDDVVFIVNF